ncbi:MAG TPA: anti-sigma regulatory factor [Planctomycetota bacterium]|nr:anti-sigma regulatory factor [Planctomycetota bacterium]
MRVRRGYGKASGGRIGGEEKNKMSGAARNARAKAPDPLPPLLPPDGPDHLGAIGRGKETPFRFSGSAEGASRDESRIRIQSDGDVVAARQRGREMSVQIGFSPSESTFLATAISELARNILNFAGHGDLLLRTIREGERQGILVEARDEGPGIPDIAKALQDGYSTSGSLGLGLPGIRRLMDEFEVRSTVGRGTTVFTIKWRSSGRSADNGVEE